MKTSSTARGQIRIRSARFLTALSRIKPSAHLWAADGKQTSSCESRPLCSSQLIKHRGSYDGSAPVRPVTACALTHVWTWSPRSREDVTRTYIRYVRRRSCIFPRWKSSWRGRKSVGRRPEATSAPRTRPLVAELRGAATVGDLLCFDCGEFVLCFCCCFFNLTGRWFSRKLKSQAQTQTGWHANSGLKEKEIHLWW